MGRRHETLDGISFLQPRLRVVAGLLKGLQMPTMQKPYYTNVLKPACNISNPLCSVEERQATTGRPYVALISYSMAPIYYVKSLVETGAQNAMSEVNIKMLGKKTQDLLSCDLKATNHCL